MKINRWILFPLIIIVAYALPRIIFGDSDFNVIFWTVWGAIFGFGSLYWSDRRARKVTGRDSEEIYEVRQRRDVTVLLDYRKAFEIVMEAVASLNPAKIKIEDFENGIIQFRTRMTWHSWGNIVTINLKKLNDNLTEIAVATRPIPRTAVIGSGESWRCVEDICLYLTEKDAEINRKVLAGSSSILDEIYVKPFQKEKVKR